MADSTLVCKGEIVEAAAPTTSADPSPPHFTGTARVHVDRCFKGGGHVVYRGLRGVGCGKIWRPKLALEPFGMVISPVIVTNLF
jgi:hypothetical protein